MALIDAEDGVVALGIIKRRDVRHEASVSVRFLHWPCILSGGKEQLVHAWRQGDCRSGGGDQIKVRKAGSNWWS